MAETVFGAANTGTRRLVDTQRTEIMSLTIELDGIRTAEDHYWSFLVKHYDSAQVCCTSLVE